MRKHFLDLISMPEGESEEDTHFLYVEIFKTIAELPEDAAVLVSHPPWSWFPILYHLRCTITHSRRVFSDCILVEGAVSRSIGLSKRGVEVLSLFRPETAIGLSLCNSTWNAKRVRQYRKEKNND